MSGFSVDWLDLREPVDVRSRDPGVAQALGRAFAGRDSVAVVDLGCGTGANLRATAPLLGPHQRWTMVDHDPALLDAARRRLTAWADTAVASSDGLELVKAGQAIAVRFRQADLAGELGDVLGDAELITASAFFDLASPRFIAALVAATVARRAAFHTVLTYDGAHAWSPPHPSDAAIGRAFDAHQARDKGFGPAAGPRAGSLLTQAFATAGYRVIEGNSPWRLAAGDAVLMAQLNGGIADAAAETGLDPGTVAAWRDWGRTGSSVGHTDMLALP